MKKARILSICNVVGSMLSRESDGNLYIRSGPEIGVASTKAFTCQLTVLLLLALYLAQERKKLPQEQAAAILNELAKTPRHLEQILSQSSSYEAIAKAMYKHSNSLYIDAGFITRSLWKER